jgi:hypothetical protein
MQVEMTRVELTWIKAHSGILLNECADQLATKAVGGNSYGPETVVAPDEPDSEEELVMADEDVTMWEEWSGPKHLPPTSVPMFSVGLAAEEECEHQMELLQRFRPSQAPEIVQVSSDSPRISTDESDGDVRMPYPDDSGIVQEASGNCFQIVGQPEVTEATWTTAHILMCQQIRIG